MKLNVKNTEILITDPSPDFLSAVALDNVVEHFNEFCECISMEASEYNYLYVFGFGEGTVMEGTTKFQVIFTRTLAEEFSVGWDMTVELRPDDSIAVEYDTKFIENMDTEVKDPSDEDWLNDNAQGVYYDYQYAYEDYIEEIAC